MKPPVRRRGFRFKEFAPVADPLYAGGQREFRGVAPVLRYGASVFPGFQVPGPVFVGRVEPEQDGEPADGILFMFSFRHGLDYIVGFPVYKQPVAVLRPEVAPFHVFFRQVRFGDQERASYRTVRELPREFLVRELGARMDN